MKHVVIVANDVLPGMGGPVAAPGLRAWGLAQGLEAHGWRTTTLVELGHARRTWPRHLPSPTPDRVVKLHRRNFGDFIRAHRPSAVIVTNSNHFDALGDLDGVPVIFDFFAPKMLELAEQRHRADLDAEIASLRTRKLAALRSCQAVIINGAKKRDYVGAWLTQAGNERVAQAVVPLSLPPLTNPARPENSSPLRIVVSGYLQPWSQPGAWSDALHSLLDAELATVTLMVASHWGQGASPTALPEALQRLASHPAVTVSGTLGFADFRQLLSSHHVSLDVFRRNPERELAFVTRSAVAISAGVPVVHVPFTEVSDLLREHDAGWLVEDSADAIHSLLTDLAEDADAVSAKWSGVERMAQALAPSRATTPLVHILEAL